MMILIVVDGWRLFVDVIGVYYIKWFLVIVNCYRYFYIWVNDIVIILRYFLEKYILGNFN